MKAIHISHDRFKLKTLSKELAREFGHELPPGLDPYVATETTPPETTLAENIQTQKSGITPPQRRFDITEAYMACDNGQAFHAALFELGYHLAKGTRRSYVIIDQYGDVHSLSRYIEGVRSKQIKAKLSDIDHDAIPTVDEVKEQIQKPKKPPIKKHLRAKLDELQFQRRLDLINEINNLEIALREELLYLKFSQQQDFEKTSIHLMKSALNLFAYIPSMRFIVHYLHTKLFTHIRKLHRKEVDALKHRHRYRLAQKQRRLKAIKKVEKREARSLQTALLRMSRIAARKIDMYNVNAFDITYISPLSHSDDEPFDPEIEALEREYSQISLTHLFNALANPYSSESDDKGYRPTMSNQCKK